MNGNLDFGLLISDLREKFTAKKRKKFRLAYGFPCVMPGHDRASRGRKMWLLARNDNHCRTFVVGIPKNITTRQLKLYAIPLLSQRWDLKFS
jgi:hypothetical protein